METLVNALYIISSVKQPYHYNRIHVDFRHERVNTIPNPCGMVFLIEACEKLLKDMWHVMP